MTDTAPDHEPLESLLRPLRRYLARLRRKLEALQADLAEAEHAPHLRRQAEALLAYLARVPRHAERVKLPDPGEPSRALEIALDPRISAHANAARLFKRAAKYERGQALINSQLERTRVELQELTWVIERAEHGREPAQLLHADLDRWLARVPWALHPRQRPRSAAARAAAAPPGRAEPAAAGPRAPALLAKPATRKGAPARLLPRRLASSEGWPVLVGRTREGNDYLTHTLARPEDYWFHVHGAAGSHVVLRRGKGKNEPSKRTLEEVAAWTAHFSQARTAGKVPVLVTRKKHVRKPRGAPPGMATCTHEKTLLVRPHAPPRSALVDAEGESE